MLSEIHQFHIGLSHSRENILIVTVVGHHNLGINSLLFIDHILGSNKLNYFIRLVRRAFRSHQCGPAEKLWRPLGQSVQFAITRFQV